MDAFATVHPARRAAYALLADARRRAGLPPLCVEELNAKTLWQLVVLKQEAERKAVERNGAGLFDLERK